MAAAGEKLELTDAQLAVELLKRKVLTEMQLKAAIDYQESVGGGLTDVLLKLELVRKATLDNFLQKLAAGAADDDTTSGDKQLEAAVDASKLKLHRKLLEKVPADLVERYEILLFFPPSGSRAILVSASKSAPSDLVANLRGRLGVDIVAVTLKPEDRAAILKGAVAGSPTARAAPASAPAPAASVAAPAPAAPALAPAPASTPAPAAPAASGPIVEKSAPKSAAQAPAPGANGDNQRVLRALINLLVRKQLISTDELKVELELMKLRSR